MEYFININELRYHQSWLPSLKVTRYLVEERVVEQTFPLLPHDLSLSSGDFQSVSNMIFLEIRRSRIC